MNVVLSCCNLGAGVDSSRVLCLTLRETRKSSIDGNDQIKYVGGNIEL